MAAFPHHQVTFNAKVDMLNGNPGTADAVLVDMLDEMKRVALYYSAGVPVVAAASSPAVTIDFNVGPDQCDETYAAWGDDSQAALKAKLAKYADGTVTITQV